MTITIEDAGLAELAQAIGAASSDKDWQFAAKHWDKVNDEQTKETLLRLARGAANVKPPPSPVYSGYSRHLSIGEWFSHGDGRWHAQVVVVSNDGKTCGIAWYAKNNYQTLHNVSHLTVKNIVEDPGFKKMKAPI